MRDFTFFNPTRIDFGKGKETNVGQHLKEFAINSALILYGSDRVKRDGLFGRVTTSLNECGVAYEELGGVVSNPLISRVRDAIRIVKEKNLQAVVAVGGGSVLDSAKAVAAGARYDGDVWDFFINKAVVHDAIPVFSVMTLAATGSEMNPFAVVTNDETKQKYFFASPHVFPKVSVINPELMATVSSDYLAYSAVDIFAHCLDLYFTASRLPEYNASLIESILQTVMRTTDALMKDAADYDARAEFAWASTMALNGNTFVGVEGNNYPTHMVEHAMSALYNVAHGAGLSVVIPAWMKWYRVQRPERFERFAARMFGVEDAHAGIARLAAWFSAIGAPVTLAEAGIPGDSVGALADNAYGFAQALGVDQAYPRDSILEILNLAAG